jgi:hypothetical protein
MIMTQTSDSDYFIAKAEQCFRLAQHIRGDRSNSEAAAELDAIANEFLARAVEIDTVRDRAETLKRRRQ